MYKESSDNMTEEKEELFLDELSYIKDGDYQEVLLNIINILPDYWFHEAASSTGKYHPEFSLGNGGLLRHTKAAVRIAFEFYDDESITGIFNNNGIFGVGIEDSVEGGYIYTGEFTVGLSSRRIILFDISKLTDSVWIVLISS